MCVPMIRRIAYSIFEQTGKQTSCQWPQDFLMAARVQVTLAIIY